MSDSVALGTARLFRSTTQPGEVLARFAAVRAVDSDELVEAVRFDQGYASPEGYAALRCLALWVHNRTDQQRSHTG